MTCCDHGRRGGGRAAPDYVDLALRPGTGPSPLYALTADGHLLLFGGAGARSLHRWVELGRAASAGRPLAVSATDRRGPAFLTPSFPRNFAWKGPVRGVARRPYNPFLGGEITAAKKLLSIS
jgi:hypothetical protein